MVTTGSHPPPPPPRIVRRKKSIIGADSVRTTNLRDHAKSDGHTHAMNQHRKYLARAKGLGAPSYSAIAQATARGGAKELKLKFDRAYFVTTEQLSLTKYT